MPLKKRRITMTAAAAAIAFTTAIPNAWAVTSPISGSTSWLSPCTDHWSVSSNVRYTSVANKQVRAKLSTTGPLGVQMRTAAKVMARTPRSATTRPWTATRTWGSTAR